MTVFTVRLRPAWSGVGSARSGIGRLEPLQESAHQLGPRRAVRPLDTDRVEHRQAEVGAPEKQDERAHVEIGDRRRRASRHSSCAPWPSRCAAQPLRATGRGLRGRCAPRPAASSNNERNRSRFDTCSYWYASISGSVRCVITEFGREASSEAITVSTASASSSALPRKRAVDRAATQTRTVREITDRRRCVAPRRRRLRPRAR